MTLRIIVDPDSASLQERPALIQVRRRNRRRFPEGCVQTQVSIEAALAEADPQRNLHPAMVYGPSVSSESQKIYYLIRWLD